MKDFHKIAIIWVIALAALAALLVSSGNGHGNITVEEAASLIESNPHLIIVDVRTPAEFKEEHIEGAINLCLTCDPTSFISHLDQSDEILLYCRSGARSEDGLRILKDNGFDNVYNMLGGIAEWNAKGYPVVK